MPLSGMTGFSRADGGGGGWRWTVEARSVNGRGLEVRFRGPSGFESLERSAREAAQARFSRGQIGLTVQARREAAGAGVTVNTEQLERYLALCRSYADAGAAAAPAVEFLLGLPGVIEQGDEEADAEAMAAVERAVAQTVVRALDELKSARLQEGAALAVVLDGLVDGIEVRVLEAEDEAARQPEILKERFARRIAELAERADLEERIVQEAALMAARADVREEIDRLHTHVAAAHALLSGEGAAGRRLDFLTQEFMREANTLCSKAGTTRLTAIGLELKAVIDQFREQVQNVE